VSLSDERVFVVSFFGRVLNLLESSFVGQRSANSPCLRSIIGLNIRLFFSPQFPTWEFLISQSSASLKVRLFRGIDSDVHV